MDTGSHPGEITEIKGRTMKYLIYGLLFIMTTGFTQGEIEVTNNKQELYLYTHHYAYRFKAVPYKSLEFYRNCVYFVDNTNKKTPVEHIILRNGKYYVHLEGDLKMDND